MSNDSSIDAEPPRKRKRRSKWGIKPEGAEEEAEPTPPPGPKGAEAAAAKINAMLASQGKLVKSDPPPIKPVLPPTRPQSQITAFSGAGGAPSSGGGLLSTPLIPPNPSLAASTGGGSHSGPHYVQDKVFVGMSKAPDDFNLKEKLEGQNGTFLTHIATQTGAKVFLRGQGSGYIEPTSKKESFEALHIYISHSNQKGLESAKKLCESLIQTVQGEFDSFMASQQQLPLGYGGGSSNYGPQAPYVNPYQHPYPPPSGAYPPPPGPPYPLMNHQGQQLPLPPGPHPPGPYQLPPYGPPPGPGPGPGPGPLPPPGPHDHYPPPNFPPPPHPNAGPPHYQGYYPPPPGMHPPAGPPPGAYPYPPSSAPMLMQEPPAEPAKPNLFTDFKRFDREPPAEKRKFQEAPVPAGVPAAENPEAKESHFSSTHTGSEVSSDGGSARQDATKGDDPGHSDNQTESIRQPPGGRTFKETRAPSSRHFEEKPPSLPNSIKKPRSFKELPPANGELGKTSQSSVAGKWESLHGTSTVLEKASSNSKIKDSKEVESAAKEPNFAQPKLRPKDMDDMPAPKLPGRSLLMKRAQAIMEQSKRAGLVAENSEVVLASNVNTAPQAKKPEEVIPPVPMSATTKTPQPSKEVSSAVVHSEGDSQPKTKALSLVSYSSEEDSDSDAE